jgi:hypothetical protein
MRESTGCPFGGSMTVSPLGRSALSSSKVMPAFRFSGGRAPFICAFHATAKEMTFVIDGFGA